MHQYFGIVSDIGFALIGLSALVLAVGSVWLRSKQLAPAATTGLDELALHRLERIERIVEASAVEIERISEGQRSAPRALAERGNSAPAERTPARHVTPH